jgi:hypothetical protein
VPQQQHKHAIGINAVGVKVSRCRTFVCPSAGEISTEQQWTCLPGAKGSNTDLTVSTQICVALDTDTDLDIFEDTDVQQASQQPCPGAPVQRITQARHDAQHHKNAYARLTVAKFNAWQSS